MVPKNIFDFSLAITIFIIFYRAYFNSASLDGFVYNRAYVRNKKPDNSRCSLMFFRRKEMLFCYFMQMKYSAINGKLGHVNTIVLISQTKIFCRTKCICIK